MTTSQPPEPVGVHRIDIADGASLMGTLMELEYLVTETEWAQGAEPGTSELHIRIVHHHAPPGARATS